mgnify:CR=1 FL=1|jgi:ABC-type dipeptide/oligopeptide/nickel transport system ATPase component|tara:strand:- start:28 stop:996 length:969 start_codon:yes stop_codon:yes gene_type:complete
METYKRKSIANKLPAKYKDRIKTPITSWINDRVYNQNQSCNILICGQVGTGKSFTALRIAEIFDVDFNVKKQVVYTKEQFNELLAEYKERRRSIEEDKDLTYAQKRARIRKEITGKVIIADEGGVIADSLDFAKKEVKDLKHNLQSIRYLNLIIIFCMPVHTQFLKAGRQLMHLYLETARVPSISMGQTYVKPYVYKKSLFTKDGRELKKFTYRTEDGFTEEMSVWKLGKPARKVWQPYERFSQASKDKIANETNLGAIETKNKTDLLGNLILYLSTNKILNLSEISRALEVPNSQIRKHRDQARANLRKLHKLKVTSFKPY